MPAQRARAKPDAKRAKEATVRPGMQDVLVAIWSLYADELLPCGRILRKRVGELLARSRRRTEEAMDVDAVVLRRLCEESHLVHIRQESGGDWSALLLGVEERFVDVHSSEDDFGEEIWCKAEAHFQEITEALPGGRYSCARALAAMRLPFLAGLSLGRVCRFVQLAISQRKLLGYEHGCLVPYHQSRDRRKEQCAQFQRPCESATAAQSMPLASLATARSALAALLQTGPLPLSNVKRLFRSRLRLELSETTLGYSKLCELLQSPHFQDICEVQLEAHGHTVLPKLIPRLRHTLSLAAHIAPSEDVVCVPVSPAPHDCEKKPRTSDSSTCADSEEPEDCADTEERPRASSLLLSVEPLDLECLLEVELEQRPVGLWCSPQRTPGAARLLPLTPSPWSPVDTPMKVMPATPSPYADFGDQYICDRCSCRFCCCEAAKGVKSRLFLDGLL